MSIRRAAVQYDIPSSTLHDCISGKVSGAVSYVIMDEEEEKELVEFYWNVQRLSHIKLVFARQSKVVPAHQLEYWMMISAS